MDRIFKNTSRDCVVSRCDLLSDIANNSSGNTGESHCISCQPADALWLTASWTRLATKPIQWMIYTLSLFPQWCSGSLVDWLFDRLSDCFIDNLVDRISVTVVYTMILTANCVLLHLHDDLIRKQTATCGRQSIKIYFLSNNTKL